MNIWSRALLLLRLKGWAALERAEDPREVLGYVNEQQQELARRVKEGLLEVAISKRQLQQQVQTLDARIPRLEGQARRAMVAGREDLARLALDHKQRALGELENLEVQVAEVGAEERRLTLAEQQLATRIDEFRVHRQSVAARYNAAEAQVRIREALSGVSRDFADLGMAMGRAEEKIDRMLARASAVDALMESGVLALPAGKGDLLERQLGDLVRQQAVDAELAAIRGQVETGQALARGNEARS